MSSIGIVGPIVEAITGRRDMEWNERQNERDRGFQYMMSSTAYQRAMEDMRIAGLNPMLAYQQGGATTASGASRSFNRPGLGNSVTEALRLNEQSKLMRGQTEQAQTQSDLNTSLTTKAEAEAANIKVNTAKLAAEIPKVTTYSNLWTEAEKLTRSASQGAGNAVESLKDTFIKKPLSEFKRRYNELINWYNNAAGGAPSTAKQQKKR